MKFVHYWQIQANTRQTKLAIKNKRGQSLIGKSRVRTWPGIIQDRVAGWPFLNDKVNNRKEQRKGRPLRGVQNKYAKGGDRSVKQTNKETNNG